MQVQNKIAKLVLGTAQIGLNYGPNKDNYTVSSERADEIFSTAYDLGIRFLDTATGYGEGHRFIGDFHRRNPEKKFNIVTKITAEEFQKNSHVIDSILDELNVSKLDGVLLHRQEDSRDPALKTYLESEKKKGKINKIGLSLYYDEDFNKNIEAFHPDFVQIPFNVLDNPLVREKEFSLFESRNIEVQGRSCFLRGAFSLTEVSSLPKDILPWIEKIKTIATKENLSANQVCLNYVVQNPKISQTLIGVDTVQQLVENVQSLQANLSSDVMNELEKIKIANPALLDLRKW